MGVGADVELRGGPPAERSGSSTTAVVRELVESLTARRRMVRPKSSSVGDAPTKYVRQLKAIVGVELTITRLEGKWKMSQNRPNEDTLSMGWCAASVSRTWQAISTVSDIVAAHRRRVERGSPRAAIPYVDTFDPYVLEPGIRRARSVA
jgi:hypothetical protein